MLYLSNFSTKTYNETKPQFPNLLKPFKMFPHLGTQVKDIAKEKAIQKAKKYSKNNSLSLRQKMKLGGTYLKYRKYLGDNYGKEQGMQMLKDQKNFVTNIFNPSYRQK